MTLGELYKQISELKEIIESQGRVKISGTHNGLDGIEVVVVTASEGTLGTVPNSKVKSVNLGFDWESGLFLIRTEDVLYRRK